METKEMKMESEMSACSHGSDTKVCDECRDQYIAYLEARVSALDDELQRLAFAAGYAQAYEELRAVIDGGSESMDHAQAVQEVRDLQQQAQDLQQQRESAYKIADHYRSERDGLLEVLTLIAERINESLKPATKAETPEQARIRHLEMALADTEALELGTGEALEKAQARIKELENYGATRADEMLGAIKRIAELERREQYLDLCLSEGEQRLVACHAHSARQRDALLKISGDTPSDGDYEAIANEALRGQPDTDALEAYVRERLGRPRAYLYKYLNCFGDEVWTVDCAWDNKAPIESTPLYALKDKS